jgi:hypothetical protein
MDYAVGADSVSQKAYRDGMPHLCHDCNKGGICRYTLRYTWDCSLYQDRQGKPQAHAVRNTGHYKEYNK